MEKLDLILLIGTLGVFVVGFLIYLTAGLYRPRKGYAIIIEKLGVFESCFDKGVHFYWPLVYKCVGYYCVVPQTRRVTFQETLTLEMTYQIVDPKLFHYSGYKAEEYMHKVRKENSELTLAILKDEFKKIGIDFINLKRPL